MTEILIAMASGLAINVITRASGKLGISKTYVSVGVSILLGVLIYVVQILANKYPLAREQIVAFSSGAYATSQIVYNIVKKITESKGQKEQKEQK